VGVWGRQRVMAYMSAADKRAGLHRKYPIKMI
jgi:hypothetical protein